VGAYREEGKKEQSLINVATGELSREEKKKEETRVDLGKNVARRALYYSETPLEKESARQIK